MAILDTSKKQLIQDRDENIFIGIDLPFRKSSGISVGGAHNVTCAPILVSPHKLDLATRLYIMSPTMTTFFPSSVPR